MRNAVDGRVGIIFTKLYLIGLFGGPPVAVYFGAIEITPLSLNEIGDFLAGAFGPLAMFWVVLGFFQQGEELQNSVDALKLQAKELQNSVEQQKEMVAVTRDGLEHERQILGLEEKKRKDELQPNFEISFGASSKSGDLFTYQLSITNLGNTVTQFATLVEVGGERLFSLERSIFKNLDTNGHRDSKRRKTISEPIRIEITFFDSERDKFRSTFEARLVENDKFPKYQVIPTEHLSISSQSSIS